MSASSFPLKKRILFVTVVICVVATLILSFIVWDRSVVNRGGSESQKPGSMLLPESTPTPIIAAQPNSNGAMDRANLYGTGVYITKGVRQLSGLKWKFKTKDAAVNTTAVIQDGIIYFGGDDGRVYAVDTVTGTENWDVKADNLNTTAPAMANNTIYVGGWDTFYALSASTGAVKWAFLQQPGEGLDPGYYANPVVAGGSVYFGGWHKFYALNSETGQEKWKLKLDGIVKSVPLVYDDTIYFGTSSPDGLATTYFYALDSENGQEKWKVRTTGDGIVGSAAIVNGILYVGTWTDGLLALDAKTGQEKWRFNPASGVLTSPAVAYNTVYVVIDRTLYAVQAKTGQEKWRFATGDTGLYSDPIIANGTVYFVTTDPGSELGLVLGITQPVGYLHAIDAQNGQELWNYKITDATSRAPVIENGVIYVGTDDGYLYAIK